MTPGQLDLPTIWRGCDWGPVELNWFDDEGNPMNLTNYVPRAYSQNINLNAEVTDILGGKTILTLSNQQTLNLTLGVEKWDWLWEIHSGGGIYRYPPFLTGKVAIKQALTPLSSNGAMSFVPSRQLPLIAK